MGRERHTPSGEGRPQARSEPLTEARATRSAGQPGAPDHDDAFWRQHFDRQTYGSDARYEDYGPAYRAGHAAYEDGVPWEETERKLGSGWPSLRGGSTLDWPLAILPAREGWARAKSRKSG